MAEPGASVEVDDIAADVRAAFSGDTDPPAPVPADEVRVEPEAQIPAPNTEPEETAAQAQARARDEAGRFVAKPEEKAQVLQATPAAPEPQPEAIRPPVSWSATAKSDFAKLAPHIQQEVLKREKDIESGQAQWASKGERLNKFDALIAPHRDRLQLAQQDEFGYVQALIKADEMLRTNPNQAIVQIAAMYGINLTGQAAQQQPQQAQPQSALSPQAIQQQIDSAVQTALQASREDQERAQYVSEWEAFRTSKDHPYADNVRNAMAALLRDGAATDLKDAYEQACWANPEVRTLFLAQQKAPAPVVPQPAGLSVTGARGNGHLAHVSRSPNGSIEDDIRGAIQELSGRA